MRMSNEQGSTDEKKWRLAAEIRELEERLVNTEGDHVYMQVRTLGQSQTSQNPLEPKFAEHPLHEVR